MNGYMALDTRLRTRETTELTVIWRWTHGYMTLDTPLRTREATE